MSRRATSRTVAGVAIAGAIFAGACGPSSREVADVRPLVVVGVDGGEWRVIEKLWEAGELPVLRSLAARGVGTRLATDYGASPVIWTTIATGRSPREHGITDFVVASPGGDVPVSSSVRRVPALWNMVSTAGRRVAAFGWWASWPAEEVSGIVVTDRVLFRELPHRTWPPVLDAEIDRELDGLDSLASLFDLEDEGQRRDLAMTRFAVRWAPERFDLLMVYFRSPDIVSHLEWRYFEPEAFSPAAAEDGESRRRAGRIPAVYRAFDAALGEILAAAPDDANILVVSDHGFHAAQPEQIQLLFDLDLVLERLGYLVRNPDGTLDFAATQVYSFRSPHHQRERRLRFALAGRESGARLLPRDLDEVTERLANDLARVRWPSGEPVFRLIEPRPRERREGVDLRVVVRRATASDRVLFDGVAWRDPVEYVGTISGTHGRRTSGIFFAAGPDIAPGAALEGIGIHDLAPTILYALDLPVGEDFTGRARLDLFSEEVRAARSLKTVTSWGTRATEGDAARSSADQRLIDELGALGYLR